MLTSKLALRLAKKLQARWVPTIADRTQLRNDLRRLDQHISDLIRAQRLLNKAVERGFHTAAQEYRNLLAVSFNRLESIRSKLPAYAAPPTGPSLADWLAEIRQLEEEFDEIEVDWKKQSLSVRTDPIELEGMSFGPFNIVLSWNNNPGNSFQTWIRCVALEPNCASGRSDVTHPHVENARLCFGEAANPFQVAMRGGRVADALVMVRSVLMTYSADSPYVAIEDWNDRSCAVCSGSYSEDDSRSCADCGHVACSDCVSACNDCGDATCDECQHSCEACDRRRCSSCLRDFDDIRLCSNCVGKCSECDEDFPKSELDGKGRCKGCIASKEPPKESPDGQTTDDPVRVRDNGASDDDADNDDDRLAVRHARAVNGDAPAEDGDDLLDGVFVGPLATDIPK